MNKDKKIKDIPYQEIQHTPLMPQVGGIQGSSGSQGITAIPTQLPGTVSGNLNISGAISANNLTGTNTGDNATNSQYSGLEASKADKGLAGTKVYYVSDTLNGPNDRKLTFTDGVLTSEI